MSKQSLYVPKNTKQNSLLSIIDSRLTSSTWNPNAVETLTNKDLSSGTNTFPSSLVSLTGSQTLTNKTLTLPTFSSIRNGGTLTLPTSTDTLVGRNTTDTLTNKTLISASISSFVNGASAIISAPTAGTNDTLLGRVSTDFVQNKSFFDSNCKFVDDVDNTKALSFSQSGQTTATTLTLATSNTVNRTITFPDITGTVALLSQIPTNTSFVDLTTNQTIAGNKSFSDYVRITNQFGLNQTNISGCTFYSNAFTSGLGGFQIDTSAQSTGFGIFKLPAIASSATYTFPSTSGFLAETVGNYLSVASQGLTLADSQTITTSAYLAGATLNFGSTTYTDSATAASTVVPQVSDVLIGARTWVGANTAITYTSAASLRIVGQPIASTNITMTKSYAVQVDSGTVNCKSLGTAAQPVYGLGVLGNEGIYSSAAGAINLATAGILRMTITSSLMTLASGMSISMAGATSVTSGTNGFIAAGPFSSSLASSAATCSIRPTNTTNTGLYGTAGTLVGISVGGTGIITCSTTGSNITGTLGVSGLSTLTSLKVGSTGTTFNQIVSGTGTTGAVIPSTYGSQTIAISFGITFSSTPIVVASITNSSVGATNINACIITVGSITTTGCNIIITNPFTSATTITVQVAYQAWN